MNSEELVFKNITSEAKSLIKPLEIVTPSMYTTLYKDIAKKHNVELNDEEISIRVIDQKLHQLEVLGNETSNHVNKLGESTNKAISAIKEKNETLLQESLLETIALKKEIKALKNSIYKDDLTKTYNRKWLYEKFLDDDNQLFSKNGFVVFVDLNYFKQINDNYGHIAGDRVLLYIVSHLSQTEGNIIRYGGDEFLIFFDDNIKIDNLLKKMEENRQSILKKMVHFSDYKFKIGYSFGIEEFKKGDTFLQILEKADTKMYQDKKTTKEKFPFKYE